MINLKTNNIMSNIFDENHDHRKEQKKINSQLLVVFLAIIGVLSIYFKVIQFLFGS